MGRAIAVVVFRVVKAVASSKEQAGRHEQAGQKKEYELNIHRDDGVTVALKAYQ